MAESYGWAGKVLRVDLTTGSITTESMDKYKAYLGGTGMAFRVLWDEVEPGVRAYDPENRVVFSVGPLTGSGSPCSGRTSITSLWPLHRDHLPAAGHMGGHWGPELKYAGWDAIIVQGESPRPVWLRIEDEKVTLEDASELWGQGIYRTTSYINNLMGAEAHVAAIGQVGEAKSNMGAVFCDRSHRAGGVGGILGAKKLKAIGVRGTGAVKIAADKKTWKELNKYYLSLMGANNNCVVARELQPWSEFSPGNTRWSGKKGLMWGAAHPPIDLGDCPDVEHPSENAPSPLNKIGLRTHKGFNDFGEEGQKRTVRMDGCHACPIRCHIAADHPELEAYGLNRYNMNTCMGNGGMRSSYTNTAGKNPASNPMLLAYMSNNLEGDYGLYNDYGGWQYAFKCAKSELIVEDELNPAQIPDPANPGQLIANPDLGKSILQKYLSADEWKRLTETKLWNTGKTPFTLLDEGDPLWEQFLIRDFAANQPGTLGYYLGLGPHHLMELWPELQKPFDELNKYHMWKMGHPLHHSIESNGAPGWFINAMGSCRDPNNHSHQNIFTNGLPKTLQRDVVQELATNPESFFAAPDESAEGKWAWDVGTMTPMNKARAAYVAQCLIWYELHNSLTVCNYTLPAWFSPNKSRNYRGDPTLEAQVMTAITGETMTHKELEKIGHRMFTLLRVLTARYMEKRAPGSGKDMRNNFDVGPAWAQKPSTQANAMEPDDIEYGKNLMYEAFGWDQATGLPTEATLNDLGLGDLVPTLRAEGLIPA